MYYGSALERGDRLRGQDVYIVGGANSAGQAAVYFAQHARSVTILVRGTSLERSMSYYLIQQIDGHQEHHRPDLHRGDRAPAATTTWSG